VRANGEPGVCSEFNGLFRLIPTAGLCVDRCWPLGGLECENTEDTCSLAVELNVLSNLNVGAYGSCKLTTRENDSACAPACGTDTGDNGGPCECGCENGAFPCSDHWCDPGYGAYAVDGFGSPATGAGSLSSYRSRVQGGPQLLENVAKTCTQFCTPDPSFLAGNGGSAPGLANGTQCTGIDQECRYLASFHSQFTLLADYQAFIYPDDGETEPGICVTASNWGDCAAPNNTPQAFWKAILPPVDASAIDEFVPGCFSFAHMRSGYENTL
jgi:hypothetical protein